MATPPAPRPGPDSSPTPCHTPSRTPRCCGLGRSRRQGSLGLLAAGLILPTLLAGCRGGHRWPGAELLPQGRLTTTLYIAIGLEKAPDRSTDLESQKRLREQFLQLQQAFQDVRPGVRLEVLVFDNEHVLKEVLRRTHSGLGPDLVLVDGLTAERLHAQQLLAPIALPNPASALLRPELIPYVQAAPNQWFALPVGLEPQLACFDRRRFDAAPTTLAGLLEASSQGRRIGLGLDLASLGWTMGSLGALESIAAVSRGEAATPEREQAIRGWLDWLRNADLQLRIRFLPSQGQLVQGLRTGRFDWISCRSQDVALLRAELGRHLGLAPLPAGPGGAASPISTVRVWGFGRNSSSRQRAAARALARFTLNPPVQRGFTIQTEGLLPVIRSASLPVASSANLAALLAAQQQAEAAQLHTEPLIALRGRKQALNRILTLFLYGELDSGEATRALIRALHKAGPPAGDPPHE
ncbi:extracellular solute-binding protein [Cyanobium sp. NIES-981]|uniref:extracellular solute-binding protein n=1 Tax=Cyanobium sp. NIES-981 TaxID=1851505 RepID=UPI0007DCBD88|nr:extracellular solute-binding protein [Cyanobium sp. NIES-981]SBO44952.1 conserved protein of unknown function [Cyanobium sp. NIES-981]